MRYQLKPSLRVTILSKKHLFLLGSNDNFSLTDKKSLKGRVQPNRVRRPSEESMSDKNSNKRRHTRVYFETADMLKLHVVHPGQDDKAFTVQAMNISESGLGFFLHKGTDIIIKESDALILEKIEGVKMFKPIRDVDMVVRWSFREEVFDHQICGCEFIKIPANYRLYLRTFIRQQTRGGGLTIQSPKDASESVDA